MVNYDVLSELTDIYQAEFGMESEKFNLLSDFIEALMSVVIAAEHDFDANLNHEPRQYRTARHHLERMLNG